MKAIFVGIILLCSVANAQETIHIHTDKQLYLPGETIWFKAYVFFNGQPSTSTNLYAGLYDASGKLIARKKYPIIEGSANGDFIIGDSVTTGALQLYMFTKTMGRDSTGVNHIIRIYNDRNKNVSMNGSPLQLIAIPEGGNLVAGMVNKLIIRSINSNGKISGSLYNTGSREFVDSFYINTDGLAEIQFIPQAGSRYYITWSNNELINQEILLPPTLATGAIIRADIAGNILHYSLQKNNNLDRFNKLHLSVYSGEDLVYKESVSLQKNNSFIGNFKTDSFPPGILEVRLTDNNNNLLQKKKILNNKQDVTLKIIEKGLGPKGKNLVEINVSDSTLHNMSISVTDAAFSTGNANSIFEILIPGTYLPEGSTSKQMDLVLNSTLVNPSKSKPEIDNFLALNISMKDKKYAVPENSTLDLIINDKGFGKQFHNLNPVSRNGYRGQGMIFYDSASVYYKVDNNKSLSDWLTAYVEDDISVPVKISPLIIKEITPAYESSLPDTGIIPYKTKQTRFNEVQVLKNVVLKGRPANPVTRRLQEIDDKYATGTFRGITKGFQLNAMDDPDAERSIDIFSYLTYRLPGIQTAGTLGSRYIRNNSFRDGEPVLFINETESPKESLETITPSQLAYVKFIPGIVVSSAGYTANGALYVYTRRGDEPGQALPNMKSEIVKGYDMSQEFKSPDHSGANSNSNPDYRTTLYWNPYLITDKDNRRIHVTYYNNDLAKKHLLVLKGFTAEGKLVEIKKLIE